MSLKKKVISKGYTLEITSWENDGDYSDTKTITVKTKEEAKMIHQICTTLFKSCNNGANGVGNSTDRERDFAVIEYYEENKDTLTYEPFIELNAIMEVGDYESEDLIFDFFLDFAAVLMGSSDFYDFRVCESVTVTYSPEDVYLEEIKF